ncbi:MAG TPA: alpha/beta fold hydrolase [Solirubrobacteraceae bacterium]
MAIGTRTGPPPLDVAALRAAPEPTRSRYPDSEGFVERDGVRVLYEVYGEGEPTIVLLATWVLAPARVWKAQIHYLARHFRVIAIDPRGNGRSDRPAGGGAYSRFEYAKDTVAVMDATGTDRAITVSLSAGTLWNLYLAAYQPERVQAAVFVGPLFGVCEPMPGWALAQFHQRREHYEGWERYNRHYIEQDFAGFCEWWMRMCVSEKPHSERMVEEGLAWGLQTTPEIVLDTIGGGREAAASDDQGAWQRIADLFYAGGAEAMKALAEKVHCPALVIEGENDLIQPPHWARALAEATGGELVMIEGAGHLPNGREPVAFNLALREFAERQRPVRTRDPVARRTDGRPRALFVSSPIGLGHAQRDVAIARQLRALKPDLQIDWLAQHPVTRVLEAEGETIHPASAQLASESGHFESESAEHDLHCFQAMRRMDELLIANFMVFHDVVSESRYDLWIGDEAWELDYFLHENPGEKRAPYAWLTDFVGVLPMPDDDERARWLAADFNEQMVEHWEAHALRDRAIFVGNAEDIIDERLGPWLPTIREWTESHFDFSGYISGFDQALFADRDALRAQLGYAPEEKVCIVSVGGSGVGESLIRRITDSFDAAKRLVPELRMIAVCGPRIDPNSFAARDGLEVRGYVHNLYRDLAACDLAVVQGGLTTAMELTSNRRPFIYFPLEHHFEQRFHVAHRLDRYRAGRRMEYSHSPPEAIAEAIAQEIGREVEYRPVETDGAANAARRIAELL